MKTFTEQCKGHTGNATTTMQEASTVPHMYGQLFIKVFCLTIRACRAYLQVIKRKSTLELGTRA